MGTERTPFPNNTTMASEGHGPRGLPRGALGPSGEGGAMMDPTCDALQQAVLFLAIDP
jgi:hypothetical protein